MLLYTFILVWAVTSLGLMRLEVTAPSVWAVTLLIGIGLLVMLIRDALATARRIARLRQDRGY